MELKELLENITIDMILEGCGLIGSLIVIYGIFLKGGFGCLAEVIGITLCG